MIITEHKETNRMTRIKHRFERKFTKKWLTQNTVRDSKVRNLSVLGTLSQTRSGSFSKPSELSMINEGHMYDLNWENPILKVIGHLQKSIRCLYIRPLKSKDRIRSVCWKYMIIQLKVYDQTDSFKNCYKVSLVPKIRFFGSLVN